MKTAFEIRRAEAADAAALLEYLKIIGGETENLSFGPEGVPLSVEAEASYLRNQERSADNVQYLAEADGEIIGTASLNRKGGRARHRGEFGISLKRAWWGCGVCAGIALGMMLVGALGMKLVPAEYFGVVERFSVFAATGFNAALGVHLFCMDTEKQPQIERENAIGRKTIPSSVPRPGTITGKPKT